ncbi:MAG: 1-acyl-sn-glycerol-3-phosphate acyltransferase [Nitrospirae bacterium]|nr:1-acyl-sn-glycerol-3-phosphate acyltransferase [Nitrospirota bacterium]
MTTFRRAYKLVLLVCLDIFFLFVGLLISLTPFLEKGTKTRVAVRGMMLWAKATCLVLGLRVRTSGAPRHDPGAFIACNHASYTDIPVIGSIIPSVFVSKHEVGSWFLFGKLARLGGTVFVRRESKTSTMEAVKEAGERLRDKINIVLFPEGTTDDGRHVKEFRSSFFRIPVDTGAPIIPVSIFYSSVDGKQTGDYPENEMAWHGDQALREHLWNLLSKKRVEVKVHFNPLISVRPGDDRKELAALACRSVREGLSLLEGPAP